MASVHGESELGSLRRRVEQRANRGRIPGVMCITTGVQLDRVRASVMRPRNGIGIGIDEQAAPDSRRAEAFDAARQPRGVVADIESTFGRDFLTPLRHDRHLAWPQPQRQFEDRFGQRHLEVEHGAYASRDALDVGVLDVPSVFAEVRCDAVGPGVLAEQRGFEGIWFVGPACLTNGGDVIDVDEQTLMRGVHVSVGCAGWQAPPVDPPAGRHYVRIQTGSEPSVKKWCLLAIVAIACSKNPSMGSSLTGAPAPRDAVTNFMGAVKSQDLQAMGAIWGTEQGAARDHMERAELDRRLIILQQCYNHDRAQILDDRVGSTPNERVVRVQVTRGNRTKTPEFKVVKGPSNRWYVADTDFPTVQGEFCAKQPSER